MSLVGRSARIEQIVERRRDWRESVAGFAGEFGVERQNFDGESHTVNVSLYGIASVLSIEGSP